ncbi:hypothetical protein SEA_CHEETO1_29 [Microbacterium phage Cheeto1]|nr:hypothetical protein SEA_CHEETO1_29 [Microbacterium phage Cheeto1]
MDTTKISVNDGITIELVKELGGHTDKALIITSLQVARERVKEALSLNASGADNFLAKLRDLDSVETILRRTRLLNQGRLF